MNESKKIASISPEHFERMLSTKSLGENTTVVDVREPHEWDYYHLEDAKLIPLNTIPQRMNEIPKHHLIYVICAHGVRSAKACSYVSQFGYDVCNVKGGMAAVSALRGFQYD